jgi:pimeloyl-ACP methyl ester carboxylesterase
MSVPAKPSVKVTDIRTRVGSTRRSFIVSAAAAVSSTLVQPKLSQAAIVQNDPAKLVPLPLPAGIRSRQVPNVNGLSFHVLEAGFETKGRPCLLLLHGYPEIAYGWRKVMLPLASAGYHVLAPDMRGYGRTTGWDDGYDADVFPFRHTNLVRDALGLVSAFGYRTASVVGRDAGSAPAAYCALIRPDVFQSVVMMTAPFEGVPALPFNTMEGMTNDQNLPSRGSAINNELAKLPRPRKYYTVYYTTREANDNMRHCSQGLHAFLRAYYHYKSADWKQNKPFRLASLTAEEVAKMPTYYVMDLDKGMAETVAEVMPTAAEIAACKWLPDDELAVYTAEYERTGFQGAFKDIDAQAPGSSQTCKHSGDARSTYRRYLSAGKAIGAFSRPPARSRPCKIPRAQRCLALTL